MKTCWFYFCICRDNPVSFLFKFVYIIYYNSSLTYAEPSLYLQGNLTVADELVNFLYSMCCLWRIITYMFNRNIGLSYFVLVAAATATFVVVFLLILI